MAFSVGGLASGLDTKSIIEQLMRIEARPKLRTEWSKALWTERKNVWSDLNTRLLNLQSAANAMNNPATWSGTPGVTSSDPTKLTGSVIGTSPAAGTYTINVAQVAMVERWNAANALPAATGGSRVSGTWYAGAFASASTSTLLTDITDIDGTSVGFDVGSTITLSAEIDGVPVTGAFTVGSTSTLDDLAQWAESNFPGATFTVNGDGTISYQSDAGASNEITALSFTATNSGGASLAVFDATAGASSTFVSAPSGGTAADTLTISQGASTWSVAISEGSDESTIAAAINATAGIGVTASVVDGKLQIVANSTGAAGSFNVTSAGSLATDLGLAETVAGQDAQFDVNGTAYTRATNTVTDVITDVSIDLLAATTSAVTLTVTDDSTDPAEVKKRAREFVDAYNAVIDLVNAKTSETKVVNPKNLADFLKGPMARDYGMSSVAFDVRLWTTDTVSGLPDAFNALDDIGITTGAVSDTYSPQNTSGRLVIDDAKLDAAIAADPAAVEAIFTRIGGDATTKTDDGISRRISDLVSELRVGGRVDAGLQGASRQVKELQSRIDRFDDRLERKRVYYERMFSSLESTLGRLQAQGQWLSGQFASLSGGS